MRFALVVEYDGADFSGSQYQANARTVQGDLERATATVFGNQTGRIRFASRTDAGVHALGQVAALDIETDKPPCEIRNALNGNIPDDLCVKKVRPATDGFDPRRDATAREYRYVINDDATPSPILRRNEYHVRQSLDAGVMADAARLFLGVHDFASFAAATSDEGSTVRRVETANIRRRSDGRVVFDIRANAFVRQQIRRMVAALINVGNGSRSIETIEALLSSPRRDAATQNAPPHGLTLMRVVYPSDKGRSLRPRDRMKRCATRSLAN